MTPGAVICGIDAGYLLHTNSAWASLPAFGKMKETRNSNNKQ